MTYAMQLRVRNVVFWCAVVLLTIFAIVFSLFISQRHIMSSAHPSPGDLPIAELFGSASVIAAICGTVLGRTLSDENEGHLPVVWTLPVSRTRYALGTFLIGVLGVIVVFSIALAVIGLFLVSFGITRFVSVPADSGLQLVRFVLLPIAFYGEVTAFTTSFARTGRGVVGYVWVGAIVLSALAGNGFPNPWGAIFMTLNLVNALHYGAYEHTAGSSTFSILSVPYAITPSLTTDIIALSILAVAGFALGIWQWRRVEA
jgi:hypothetical protein